MKSIGEPATGYQKWIAKHYSATSTSLSIAQISAGLWAGYRVHKSEVPTDKTAPKVGIPPVRTLDQLSPTEIANMSLDDIKAAIPYNKGWTFENNNGHVHIRKNANSKPIIKIDPPDKVGTPYWHMHFLDGDGNPLDINGNVVPRRSPAAHIPWNQGPQ